MLALARSLLVFDLHFPEEDKGFWSAFLALVPDAKPNLIVLGGDIADAESVSRHGGNPSPPKLRKEVDYVRARLTELRTAAGPKCRIVYLKGNHEERLDKYLAELAPGLAGLAELGWPALLGLDALGIEWVPTEDQPICWGPGNKLKVVHGHQMGGGLYPARKLVEVYGEPGGTVFCGHFHRAQVFTRTSHPKPSQGVVVPCGRSLNPSWHPGPTSWGHGVVLTEGLSWTVLGYEAGGIRWGPVTYR